MGGRLALIILEIPLPARSGVGGGLTRSSLGRLPGARQWARFPRKLGQTNMRTFERLRVHRPPLSPFQLSLSGAAFQEGTRRTPGGTRFMRASTSV